MSYPVISGQRRTTFGSKASTQARTSGQVPIAISRSGDESVHALVAVLDAEQLTKRIGQVVILDLGEGGKHQVLVVGSSVHPVSDRILHLDCLAVTEDKEVRVKVAVVPNTIECPGMKAGGILEQMVRRVEVRCMAAKIPNEIPVDCSPIQLGQTVYAEQLPLPEGVTLVTRPRTAILTIARTRGMKKTEDAATPATPAKA